MIQTFYSPNIVATGSSRVGEDALSVSSARPFHFVIIIVVFYPLECNVVFVCDRRLLEVL